MEKKRQANRRIVCKMGDSNGCIFPIWKPHGLGPSRWPMDRNLQSQKIAKRYIELRYKLMAYTYTYALKGAITGEPIARPMYYDFPEESEAWKNELQYMWGEDILVAPIIECNKRQVWLPKGEWVDFWTNSIYQGNKTINYSADVNSLPLFVKSGAIIPMYEYALSTKFIDFNSVELHTFDPVNENSCFELWQDDGQSYITESKIKKPLLEYKEGQHNGIKTKIVKGYQP